MRAEGAHRTSSALTLRRHAFVLFVFFVVPKKALRGVEKAGARSGVLQVATHWPQAPPQSCRTGRRRGRGSSSGRSPSGRTRRRATRRPASRPAAADIGAASWAGATAAFVGGATHADLAAAGRRVGRQRDGRGDQQQEEGEAGEHGAEADSPPLKSRLTTSISAAINHVRRGSRSAAQTVRLARSCSLAPWIEARACVPLLVGPVAQSLRSRRRRRSSRRRRWRWSGRSRTPTADAAGRPRGWPARASRRRGPAGCRSAGVRRRRRPRSRVEPRPGALGREGARARWR